VVVGNIRQALLGGEVRQHRESVPGMNRSEMERERVSGV
jgi:hypothetical protein